MVFGVVRRVVVDGFVVNINGSPDSVVVVGVLITNGNSLVVLDGASVLEVNMVVFGGGILLPLATTVKRVLFVGRVLAVGTAVLSLVTSLVGTDSRWLKLRLEVDCTSVATKCCE